MNRKKAPAKIFAAESHPPMPGDALLIVDVQNDFLPGGALPVPDGDAVIPVLNRYIASFSARQLPIFVSRDWHPANHCSFIAAGGAWPVHCVAESYGANFPSALALPSNVAIVSKGTRPDSECYSAFGTGELDAKIRAAGAQRVWVGGLATDYCVLHTVRDAIAHGFEVLLLLDAIRAVDVTPGDGRRAEKEMLAADAQAMHL